MIFNHNFEYLSQGTEVPASGTEAVGGPPGLAAAEVERSWHFRTLTSPPAKISP